MTEESVQDVLNRLDEAFPEGANETTEEKAQRYLRMKNAVAEVNRTSQARIEELRAQVRHLTATNLALEATRDALQNGNRNGNIINPLEALNNHVINENNREKNINMNNNENNNMNNNENNNKNDNDNSSKNVDEKDFDMRGDLFKKSTHRYLFMDTITRLDNTSFEVRWKHTILALSVIALQIFGYCFVAFSLFKKHEQERNSRTRPRPEIDPTIVSVLIPTIGFVLFAFVLPDLFELFILLKCKGWKTTLAGLLILFKSVVALIVGALIGVCMPVIGKREAFLLYVGLILVHKVDGRIGYLQHILKKIQDNYAFLYPVFGGILIPIILTIFPRIV